MRLVRTLVLSSLAALFLLRVIGQFVVALFGVAFLPPIAEWQSGLLPYPWLLTSQIVILGLQTLISRDLWRGVGFFAVSRPRFGSFLRWFSVLYFASMVLRYTLTMTFYPERRWFSGTIPIFFHCVLAAYLFVLSLYHNGRPFTSTVPEQAPG